MKKTHKELFEQYFKEQLSKESLRNIQEIQTITRIRDNDALWLVLIALEYYRDIYHKIPLA